MDRAEADDIASRGRLQVVSEIMQTIYAQTGLTVYAEHTAAIGELVGCTTFSTKEEPIGSILKNGMPKATIWSVPDSFDAWVDALLEVSGA